MVKESFQFTLSPFAPLVPDAPAAPGGPGIPGDPAGPGGPFGPLSPCNRTQIKINNKVSRFTIMVKPQSDGTT